MIKVRQALVKLLGDSEMDAEATISKDDFLQLLTDPAGAKELHRVGVDPVALIDAADFIFRDIEELTFSALLDTMLNLRGGNSAKVRDVVDMRKFLMAEFHHNQEEIKACL